MTQRPRPEPAPVIPVDPDWSVDQTIAAAAAVVPRPAQVAWQRQELIAFTHFGMNTYTDREWGSGMEDPAWFAPDQLSVDQWMAAYQAMGARTAMLTAKHHDGFVLYPSRYTSHSVAASPHGRDVLRAYVDTAGAVGLNVGVYLSPSDGAELPHRWHAEEYVPAIRSKPADLRTGHDLAVLADAPRRPGGLGRYGNGSVRAPRVIPTLVADGDRAKAVADGRLPSFEYAVNDYDAYYLNQLYEIFTEYGPITELWLDGANPWAESGIRQDYDFTAWFDLVERLSPTTVVFAGPGGVRWVGNEDGYAREGEWSVCPLTADPTGGHNEALQTAASGASDIGSRMPLTDPSTTHLQWFPAEADTSIRPGWFHHASETPKSLTDLIDIYRGSVGRNAVLLLNAPPGPDGRLPAADVDRLREFGATLRATYADNLLLTEDGATDPVASTLTDGSLETCWSPDDGATTGTVELALPGRQTFDQVRLGEDITAGQRIEALAVEHASPDGWRRTATATTVGYSRLLVLDEPVETDRIRLRVLAARATPRLAFVGLYRTPAALGSSAP